eukprot:GILI01012410.1.p1 GENE.GILI01012410.1~~GILI01012410.1.p1  ORF type:complete len:196 (-),score=51.24 GILI01012410.1:217-804(-)
MAPDSALERSMAAPLCVIFNSNLSCMAAPASDWLASKRSPPSSSHTEIWYLIPLISLKQRRSGMERREEMEGAGEEIVGEVEEEEDEDSELDMEGLMERQRLKLKREKKKKLAQQAKLELRQKMSYGVVEPGQDEELFTMDKKVKENINRLAKGKGAAEIVEKVGAESDEDDMEEDGEEEEWEDVSGEEEEEEEG